MANFWEQWDNFMSRFWALCRASDVNAETVSKKTGISLSTISKWDAWDSMPNVESLIKLSIFFECSIDYLIGINNHSEGLNKVLGCLSRDNQELVQAYAELLFMKQTRDEKKLDEAFEKIKMQITGFDEKYRFATKYEAEKIEAFISKLGFLEDGFIVDKAEPSQYGEKWICFMSGKNANLKYILCGQYADFMQDIELFSAFSPYQLLIDADEPVDSLSIYVRQCIYIGNEGNPVEISLKRKN